MSSSSKQPDKSTPSPSPNRGEQPSGGPRDLAKQEDNFAADPDQGADDVLHQPPIGPIPPNKPRRNPVADVEAEQMPLSPQPSVQSSLPPDEATQDEATRPLAGHHPIPPPSEPMQYRAIGLVHGRYQPSEEQFNRGAIITTEEGIHLDAVLLGQVISLVKKYLDLEQSFLWVVYPRTREKQDTLHLQVVGVWSEEGFGPMADEQKSTKSDPINALVKPLQDGYFSIRGEIVFHAPERQFVIVQVQQAPRKKGDSPRHFKLQLAGTLASKTLGYFWDLQVQREGANLVIQEGTPIGLLPPKKKSKKHKSTSSSFPRKPRKTNSDQATDSQTPLSSASWQTPRTISKPVKRPRLPQILRETVHQR